MTEKIKITQGIISGGLQSRSQIYKMNYLPKENELNDKIEFALITPAKGSSEQIYTSIRFNEPDEIKTFIRGLVKSYAFFLFKKGRLNSYNVISIPELLKREMVCIFKSIFRFG